MTMAVTLSSPLRAGIRSFQSDSGRPGKYARNGEDAVSRFHRLVRKWRIETAYVSSTSELFEHPSFVEIVSMGKEAVPLIIDELERQPDLLVGALTRITGENPVTTGDQGDVYAMIIAWNDWFQRRFK